MRELDRTQRVVSEAAFLVGVLLHDGNPPARPLEELEGLAKTAGARVVGDLHYVIGPAFHLRLARAGVSGPECGLDGRPSVHGLMGRHGWVFTDRPEALALRQALADFERDCLVILHGLAACFFQRPVGDGFGQSMLLRLLPTTTSP